MALCNVCGNFDDEHIDGQIDMFKNDPDISPIFITIGTHH